MPANPSWVIGLRDGEGPRHSSTTELTTWLQEQPKVAVDTETAGLTWDAEVRTVQFGNATEGFCVMVASAEAKQFVVDTLMAYPGGLIMHNAPFDIRRLHQVGMNPSYLWPRTENTDVMARVLSPNETSYKLKWLSKVWMEDETASAEAELNERKRKHNLKSKKATVKWDFATVPLWVQAPYAIKDTFLAFRLYELVASELSPAEWQVVQREYLAAEAVAEVSYKGLRLDIQYAEELYDWWTAVMEDEEKWFAEQLRPYAYTEKDGKRIGVEPNPLSLDQQRRYLLDKGWRPTKFTAKTKEPQLDKSVLIDLAPDYEFVRRLMEYKRMGKWRSAYVENSLTEAANDGRVHATYKSIGAKTGRMSCANPPLQQLPKGGGGEVRRLYIASPGNLICSVDYSQIEMRLAGHFSKDPYLIQAYAEERDIYQEMADFVGCTRPQAKIVSLAALYGSKGKSIAKALGVTQRESVTYVDKFWEWTPTLSKWSKAVEHNARAHRPTVSMWGRRLAPHVPYAAGNAIIQGTAAEVMKDGILRMAESGLLEYVVGIVHDEVVLDVPEADAWPITNKVASVLEDRRFAIPLTTEASVYGRSWGDGYTD